MEDPSALQSQGPLALTVERALNDYLREHVATKVTDKYRQQKAAEHLIAHFGSTPIADVDIPSSRRYVQARLSGAVGGGGGRHSKVGALSTIRREMGVLTAAANHARKWKRLTVMPIVERPVEEQRDEGQPYFDADVVARLISTATGELRHFIKLAYYTGARRASIEELTAEQCKLFNRQIILATPGKARTKKRQPIVPIFDEIVPDVAALVGARPFGRLFKAPDFYDQFMGLCRSLDLEEPHHPHMLRHSRATHLLQAGKDIWDVAKLLGDTVAQIEKTYGHHSPDMLRKKLG